MTSVASLRGRAPRYLARRAASLSRRYGIRDAKAIRRLRRCVEVLSRYDVSPTFATPGRVIERHPGFFRELADDGVEFAVHGYDHVDFRMLEPAEARRQLVQAVAAFDQAGVAFEGFRCPYLSYTDEVASVVPKGVFRYSSNEAIRWDVFPGRIGGATYAQLDEFYAGALASETVSTPRSADGLIEIPVALPDDLQLLDGVGLRGEEIAEPWLRILEETHRRGELFAPLLHPETFDHIRVAIEGVIQRARQLEPAVWTAQLREIASWWKERSRFAAAASVEGRALRVDLLCSKRATVLARDWAEPVGSGSWEGRYRVISNRTVRLDPGIRPFVGLSGVSGRLAEFLGEQGYIVDLGPKASSCTVHIDGERVRATSNDVQLVDYIESTAGSLLKFGRWPDGAKSALCLAGDLDALSLRDYASRLLPRQGSRLHRSATRCASCAEALTRHRRSL
jgi:peptidoglycan/xylan/chitin deacetylase (PgdA/CDA1 family)